MSRKESAYKNIEDWYLLQFLRRELIFILIFIGRYFFIKSSYSVISDRIIIITILFFFMYFFILISSFLLDMMLIIFLFFYRLHLHSLLQPQLQ